MVNVGRLESGVTYVYEKQNGITYARKFGDPPDKRFEVGRDYDGPTVFGMSGKIVSTWVDILKSAEHNPALQDAIDRVKVIYELSHQEQTVDHHPV